MVSLCCIQRRPIIRIAFTSLLVLVQLLTRLTITRSWPLCTKTMSDPNHFIRRLSEHSTVEIMGLGLTVSNGSHLHLTLLHT